MKGNYVLSPQAQTDVDGIWEYTIKRWGVDQAEIYIRQLFSHIDMIAKKSRYWSGLP